MVDAPEPLPAELADAIARVRKRLDPIGQPLLYFPVISSTNDVAARLGAGGTHEGAVIMADAQTAGRGRRGHSWFSPSGSGLYISTVLRPAAAKVDPARATSLVTLAAGVALAEGIERATGLAPAIKWPNDLLVGRRKLSGILAEGMIDDQRGGPSIVSNVVLGYGINVGLMAAPPDLREQVTSLESELGRPVDRWLVAAETLAAVAGRYRDLLDGRFDAILDDWRRRSPATHGGRVAWMSGASRRSGVAIGVDDMGALIVRVGSTTERIVAGELEWQLP
jgi:BirA family transcriptional regulator, biotin operon repressor / biotin---[acetyl-CoA-carboxylase] ligase